jgi:hypothetical protein
MPPLSLTLVVKNNSNIGLSTPYIEPEVVNCYRELLPYKIGKNLLLEHFFPFTIVSLTSVVHIFKYFGEFSKKIINGVNGIKDLGIQ